MSAWRKAGWRSLLHRGYPKLVVRFTNGSGKAKLLCNPQEFAQNELAAGRVPECTLQTLVQDAEKVWFEMAKETNTERKTDNEKKTGNK